jgi:DNA-binding transcriptional MerR regulator
VEFTSQQVEQMFSISRETVRSWVGEFSDYLSPTATPPKGRQRHFTEEDLAVFALVAELKEKRWKFADIHPLLQAGERGQPPIDLHPQLFDTDAADEATLKRSLEYAQQMIQTLTNRVEELEGQISKANTVTNKQSHTIAALKAERDQLSTQLNEMQGRVLDAYRQGWQDGMKNE